MDHTCPSPTASRHDQKFQVVGQTWRMSIQRGVFLIFALLLGHSDGVTLSGSTTDFKCAMMGSSGGTTIIRRNVVWGQNASCNTTGITIVAGDVVIEENYFLNSKFPIRILSGGALVKIYRNSFVGFTEPSLEFIIINAMSAGTQVTIANNIFYADSDSYVGGSLTSFIAAKQVTSLTISSNWFWYGGALTAIDVLSGVSSVEVSKNYFYGSLVGLTTATISQILNNTFVSEDPRSGSGAILFKRSCAVHQIEDNHFKWTSNNVSNVNSPVGSTCIRNSPIDRTLQPTWSLENGMGALFNYVPVKQAPSVSSKDLIVSVIIAGTAVADIFPNMSVFTNEDGVITRFTVDGSTTASEWASTDYIPAQINFRWKDGINSSSSIYFQWTGDDYWYGTPDLLPLDINFYLSEISISGEIIDLNRMSCNTPFKRNSYGFLTFTREAECIIRQEPLPSSSIPTSTSTPSSTSSSTPSSSFWTSETSASTEAPTEGIVIVSSETSGDNSTVFIGAGVGGGVILLILLSLLLFLVMRRRRSKNLEKENEVSLTHYQMPAPPNVESSYVEGVSPSIPASVRSTVFPTNQLSQSDFNIQYSDLTIISELGQGAYGTVLLGEWRGSRVAVKKLKKEIFTQKNQDAFVTELKIHRNLRPHANVVTCLGLTQSPLTIVTDYVERGSLVDVMKREKLDDSMRAKIAEGVAAGMFHLHTEGIIHRDLAARNVLLTEGHQPKLSDLGMSRVVEEEQSGMTTSEVGPLRWMAPESVSNREYSTKSDVWMYGCLLFELYTNGQLPHPELDALSAATGVAFKGLVPKIPGNVKGNVKVVMEATFKFKGTDRPSFQEILKMMRQ
eukprot:TRINITY_DN2594_c0_g3_i1.p1 TRINITY_DN2594_c0_g3~~TRINITY_DN2594_c0_g3_i1.p1  ORF type:complete len:844 (-),score=158.73 TRINITY_DN2594_c0_g3_i1:63-2594(-)